LLGGKNLDLFGFISLFGGLALFLYGMSVLGGSLEKASEGRLEKVLEKLTDNPVKGVLLGAGVTAAIQSSSATTVIIVGLVNARVMKLRQAIGVIMGANIGTTITAHILRLTSVEGDNFFLRLISPDTLAPVMAIAGILLFFAAKGDRAKEVGQMLLGFGILFTGMFQMEAAVEPLRELPAFARLFQTMTNPIVGVLVGAGVTAVIQSSSASVGILQALSSTGAITWSAAVPIILGQNIGTCITPILASVGASKNAKRSAFVHLSLNLAGTAIFLVGTYAVQSLVGIPFWGEAIDKGGIANFHTIFNVTITVIFLPFIGFLERCAYFFVPKGKDEDDGQAVDKVAQNLDQRLLVSPGLAIDQARGATYQMADLARKNFGLARDMILDGYNSEKAATLAAQESVVDTLQDRIENYLIQLSRRHLTENSKGEVSEILHMIGEFERIADQSENIMEAAQSLHKAGGTFSPEARKEMELYSSAVEEILDTAIGAYKRFDIPVARRVEPLEQVIDIAEEQLKNRHIGRLRDGACSVDAAFAFVEALSSMERIADHCSNVGMVLIAESQGYRDYDTHAYLHALHKSQTPEYAQAYQEYELKYLAALGKLAGVPKPEIPALEKKDPGQTPPPADKAEQG
jgi:phosphate:Na+ symporter